MSQLFWQNQLSIMESQLRSLNDKVKSGTINQELINEINNELSDIAWRIRKEFWDTVYCDGCGAISTRRIGQYSICDSSECKKNVIG